MHHMWLLPVQVREGIKSWALGLQVVVSCHMGAGT